MTTNSQLEQLFKEQEISHRILYPLWYRINRGIGLWHKPPVMLNLAEHYLYTAPCMLLIIGTVALLHRWLTGQMLSSAATPLLVMFLAPFLSWLRYRSIRRRIGLAGSASPVE